MSHTRVSGIFVLLLAGCGGSDDRLVQVALESTGQQADQNRRMGELQREIASGTRTLIEADARARQQFAELQREAAEQQIEIGRQRDQLELDRRRLAEDRHRENILAKTLDGIAHLLACLLPLAISLLVLWPRPETPQSADLATLLIHELASTAPRLTGPALIQERPSDDQDPAPESDESL